MTFLRNPKHETAAAKLAAGTDTVEVYCEIWHPKPHQTQEQVEAAAYAWRKRLMPRILELRETACRGTVFDTARILNELAIEVDCPNDGAFDETEWLAAVKTIALTTERVADQIAARGLLLKFRDMRDKRRSEALRILSRITANQQRHIGDSGQTDGPRVVSMTFNWGTDTVPAVPVARVVDVSCQNLDDVSRETLPERQSFDGQGRLPAPASEPADNGGQSEADPHPIAADCYPSPSPGPGPSPASPAPDPRPARQLAGAIF